MNKNAFADVRCPFDYKAELSKARHALDEKVRDCAARHAQTGYRDLAKLFKLSPGTLCKIAKGCKPAVQARTSKRAEKKGDKENDYDCPPGCSIRCNIGIQCLVRRTYLMTPASRWFPLGPECHEAPCRFQIIFGPPTNRQ